MDSIEMSMVFGTASGYGKEINEKVLSIDIVAKDLLSILEQVKEETGIYVSGNLSESRSLYHPDWGCPENGEKVYEYCGSANPLFIPDPQRIYSGGEKSRFAYQGKI